MKKIITLTSLLLLITACGKESKSTKPSNPSLLSGLEILFNNGDRATFNLTHMQYLAANGCFETHSYRDLNPGSSNGQVCLTLVNADCNSHLIGETIAFEYWIVNGRVSIMNRPNTSCK